MKDFDVNVLVKIRVSAVDIGDARHRAHQGLYGRLFEGGTAPLDIVDIGPVAVRSISQLQDRKVEPE